MVNNVLLVKGTGLLIKRIQELISSYHRVIKKLCYHLKKDIFQNCHPK